MSKRKYKLPKRFTVTLTKGDLNVAESYTNEKECLLCQGIKDKFPHAILEAGGYNVYIDSSAFKIEPTKVSLIHIAYSNSRVLPFTVELTKL